MKYHLGYYRESREYQVSVEVQKQNMLNLSLANKHNIEYWFGERKSAFKGKRPEFEKMVKQLEDHNCAGVYFAKVDRSFRNLADMMQLERFIGKKEIIFVNGEFDLSTPQGRKDFRSAGIDAVHYSEDLSFKVKDAQKYMLEQGKIAHQVTPYLTRKDGHLYHNKHTNTAKTIIEMYSTGVHSYKGLAAHANNLGYKNPQNRKFTKAQIEAIVCNPIFAGFYKDNHQKEYALKMKPVITRVLFDQIEKIRLNRNRTAKKKMYPYSRFIKYDSKHYLVGETVKGNVYYRAQSGNFQYTNPKRGRLVKQVKEEWINDSFVAFLNDINIKESFTEDLRTFFEKWGHTAFSDKKQRRREILAQIESIENKLVQAPIDYMDGRFSADILEKVTKRLEEEKLTLQESLKGLQKIDDDFFKTTEALVGFIEFFKKGISDIDSETHRIILELFVESVKINDREIIWKPTEYLSQLEHISQKNILEPNKSHSHKENSVVEPSELKAGRGSRSVAELLTTLNALYKKSCMKERLCLLQVGSPYHSVSRLPSHF